MKYTLPTSSPGDLNVQYLRNLLNIVRDRAAASFSGIGVIVTADPDNLPLTALRDQHPDLDADLATTLIRLASQGSPYHDGFHVLSPQGRILRVAQYFSPPILPDAVIDRRRPIGARYVAALYGSAVPGVLITGIAGQAGGVSIFVDGADVAAVTQC
jgi:hypothetical protein